MCAAGPFHLHGAGLFFHQPGREVLHVRVDMEFPGRAALLRWWGERLRKSTIAGILMGRNKALCRSGAGGDVSLTSSQSRA